MKINTIRFVIALLISILIGYGFYAFWQETTKGSQLHIIIIISSFIYSLVSLSNMFCINYNSGRTTTLVRTVSSIFFAIGIIVLLLFSKLFSSVPAFIISIGIIFLVYFLIIYSLVKSNQ